MSVQIIIIIFFTSHLIEQNKLEIHICLLQNLSQRRMLQNAWNIEHQAKEYGGQDIASHEARQAYSYYPGRVEVGKADSLQG